MEAVLVTACQITLYHKTDQLQSTVHHRENPKLREKSNRGFVATTEL
jgi:hypothetical protein